MFRRNPDAIALMIIGLFALALNIPRIIIEHHSTPHMTPLKMELETHRPEIRAIRAAAECFRRSIQH